LRKNANSEIGYTIMVSRTIAAHTRIESMQCAKMVATVVIAIVRNGERRSVISKKTAKAVAGPTVSTNGLSRK